MKFSCFTTTSFLILSHGFANISYEIDCTLKIKDKNNATLENVPFVLSVNLGAPQDSIYYPFNLSGKDLILSNNLYFKDNAPVIDVTIYEKKDIQFQALGIELPLDDGRIIMNQDKFDSLSFSIDELVCEDLALD